MREFFVGVAERVIGGVVGVVGVVGVAVVVERVVMREASGATM